MNTPVVTICGSMRFYELMLSVARQETVAGTIVLMPFAVIGQSDQDGAVKRMLDRLHREKIAMSDRVIVVADQTGYYGRSTAGEIEHAHRLGLPVDYWRATAQHERADVAEPTFEIERGGPRTVPCGWGCGFLAASEAELDAHEADCGRDLPGDPVPDLAPVPQPRRAVVSLRRDRPTGGVQQ